MWIEEIGRCHAGPGLHSDGQDTPEDDNVQPLIVMQISLYWSKEVVSDVLQSKGKAKPKAVTMKSIGKVIRERLEFGS